MIHSSVHCWQVAVSLRLLLLQLLQKDRERLVLINYPASSRARFAASTFQHSIHEVRHLHMEVSFAHVRICLQVLSCAFSQFLMRQQAWRSESTLVLTSSVVCNHRAIA